MAAAIVGFWWFPGPRRSVAIPEERGGFALEAEAQTFARYGGSASCRECHEEAYALWQRSHHGLAEREPRATEEEPAFLPPRTFRHATQQTSVGKGNGRFTLTTRGLGGTQEVFAVDRVIGNAPLRQLLLPFPGGRWQATEACWDPRSNEWFNVYGAEDRQPGEWGHWTGRGMNWNAMCATCHNTRLRKNYVATNDTYRTAMVERGVGCEACHGPMQDHNAWQYANKGRGLKDPTLRKLSRDQMLDTCAACHARRTEITGDPRPGDGFFDHHLLAIVDESDLFYADGQVREEDYEFTAFLGSRMSNKDVRCVDCHDFHSAKTKLPANLQCLTCHSGAVTNAPIINPVTHSRHKVFGFDAAGVMTNPDVTAYRSAGIKETGGECVNCHMPQTVYMQRHVRHDHGFTIPDPLLTQQFGIPNACNRCHADKTVAWALEYTEQWYGAKMERPYRQRAQTVARARAGDPAARGALLTMLRSDAYPYWRAVAANLLERWSAEPEVVAALTQSLSDTNALVRQNVVQSLGTLGEVLTPELRAALESCLRDPARNVRVVAAQALAATLDTNCLAASELRQLLEHNADQPTGQMQLGLFAFSRGDVTNALTHFRTAAEWDPFSPSFRHQAAVVLSQQGRLREALAELQAAVRAVPRDAESHFKLALAWSELGEAAAARRSLEEAVRLDPRHARAWYNLGLARHAAGNSEGALQALLTAEQLAPESPQIPYARATIHAQLGEFREARAAARRAIELNPQFSDAIALLNQIGPR
jgi:tetratricopeptide (TPR) repeat protein